MSSRLKTGLLLLAITFLLGYILLEKFRTEVLKSEFTTLPDGYHNVLIRVPTSFEFCGEQVPLYDEEVKESFDKELYINVFHHSATSLIIKRSEKYFPIIEQILREEDVPDDMKYIAVIESGLENVRSYAGADGYWQFMEATAKEFNLEISPEVDERFHIEKSTRAACKYLKRSFKKFGNWTLVAASYNRGMGGMNSALRNQNAISYYDVALNNETARYIYRALAFKEIMQHPEKYGFVIPKELRYPPVEYRKIILDTTITDISALAARYKMSYKTLKYHNPWLLMNKLSFDKDAIKQRKTYTLFVPQNPPMPHSNVLAQESLDMQKMLDSIIREEDTVIHIQDIK
jgi:hypothetical protein